MKKRVFQKGGENLSTIAPWDLPLLANRSQLPVISANSFRGEAKKKTRPHISKEDIQKVNDYINKYETPAPNLPITIDAVAPPVPYQVQQVKELVKDADFRDIMNNASTQQLYNKIRAERIQKERENQERKKQAELQRRHDAIKAADELQKDKIIQTDRQSWYKVGDAVGERGRLFPNHVGDNYELFDEYLNPLMLYGKIAKGLGQAPLKAQKTNSIIPYIQAIGTPLVYRALGSKPFAILEKTINGARMANGIGDQMNNLYENLLLGSGKNILQDEIIDKTNEQIENDLDARSKQYKMGGISLDGYKKDSPDRFNSFNIIPSNNITMKNVPYPVFGIDDSGAAQFMLPGYNYRYPGNSVFEIPLKRMQAGGDVLQHKAQQRRGPDYNFHLMHRTPNAADSAVYRDLYNRAVAGDPKAIEMLNDFKGNFWTGMDPLAGAMEDVRYKKGITPMEKFNQAITRENALYDAESDAPVPAPFGSAKPLEFKNKGKYGEFVSGYNYRYPAKMQVGGQNVVSQARQQFGQNEEYYTSPNTPETDKLVYITDLVNYSLGSGVNPATTKHGRILYSSDYTLPGTNTSVRSLYDALNIFNQRSDIKQLSPEQRLDLFYNKLYSSDKGIQDFKAKVKTLGYGAIPFFRNSPDGDIQNLLAQPRTQAPQSIAIRKDGGEQNSFMNNEPFPGLPDKELTALQNFFKQKWIASKTNQNPLGQSGAQPSSGTMPSTVTTEKVMDPFWGVAGVAGLSFIANALENRQNQNDQSYQRKLGLTDNIGPVVSGNNGDYSPNDGFFKANRQTPVQFGAIRRAKNGGYFDVPQDYKTLAAPTDMPDLPRGAVENIQPEQTDNESGDINVNNFKSGINNIELSGNREGYNINHNNGSSAFGPYGFLANQKAALGYLYKKYFKKDMTFPELVNKMKQDGQFHEQVMNLHSQDLLKEYNGNPFAAAMEHFAGPRAASKFVHGNLNLDDSPGKNNVTYRTYLNKFSKGAGLKERFQVGGEYNVTPDELMSIIAGGGQIEYV